MFIPLLDRNNFTRLFCGNKTVDVTSYFLYNKKDVGENEINVCFHFETVKKALSSI